MIAAELRGGLAPWQTRAQPESALRVRCSAARWQRGSEPAQTVKFDEQSDLQNSVHQSDSHEGTALSHAASTAGSSVVVSGSNAGASTAEDASLSVEDVQQAFAELSPAYNNLTPSEKELVASALQTATASPDNLPGVRAEALAVLQSAAAASVAAASPISEKATELSTANELSQEALNSELDEDTELDETTWEHVCKGGLGAGLRAVRSQCRQYVIECRKLPSQVAEELFDQVIDDCLPVRLRVTVS
jgi:hypothetical protein